MLGADEAGAGAAAVGGTSPEEKTSAGCDDFARLDALPASPALSPSPHPGKVVARTATPSTAYPPSAARNARMADLSHHWSDKDQPEDAIEPEGSFGASSRRRDY